MRLHSGRRRAATYRTCSNGIRGCASGKTSKEIQRSSVVDARQAFLRLRNPVFGWILARSANHFALFLSESDNDDTLARDYSCFEPSGFCSLGWTSSGTNVATI